VKQATPDSERLDIRVTPVSGKVAEIRIPDSELESLHLDLVRSHVRFRFATLRAGDANDVISGSRSKRCYSFRIIMAIVSLSSALSGTFMSRELRPSG
jgi:hypothetical protein